MKNINDVEVILTRMIELLRIGAFDDWAVALEKIKSDFEVDPKYSSLKLLAMYGGVGALNDVVLYREGQPLVLENNELDSLRTQLYEVCKK
jgi:hypothetical protein